MLTMPISYNGFPSLWIGTFYLMQEFGSVAINYCLTQITATQKTSKIVFSNKSDFTGSSQDISFLEVTFDKN